LLSKGEEDRARKRDVLTPTKNRSPLSVLNLKVPAPELFDRTGRHLGSKQEILKIARVWNRSILNTCLVRDAAVESDAFRALYAGSEVFLRIPAEEKYRAELMTQVQSSSAYERASAASDLACYRGPETEKILWPLLQDMTESQGLFAADVIWSVNYPVRRAAYNTLQSFGLAVPDVVLERAATEEEKRRLRTSYWTSSFRQALPPDWTVLSVSDGLTKPVLIVKNGNEAKTRDLTVVLIDVTNRQEQYRITLVPTEWPAANATFGQKIGVHSKGAQGSRIFWSDKALPEDLRSKLIKYYGLLADQSQR
jgi:hypothetical protein